MQAIIDGKTWTATEIEARREGSRIVVEGSSAIGTLVRVVFDADTVGHYRLGEGRSEAVLVDEFTEWTAYGFGSGSGMISEIDGERVAGSFGFRGKDTSGIASDREIASGKFDVDFAD